MIEGKEWRRWNFLCSSARVALGDTFPSRVGRDSCRSVFENNELSACRLPHTTDVWALREERDTVMGREREGRSGSRES